MLQSVIAVLMENADMKMVKEIASALEAMLKRMDVVQVKKNLLMDTLKA